MEKEIQLDPEQSESNPESQPETGEEPESRKRSHHKTPKKEELRQQIELQQQQIELLTKYIGESEQRLFENIRKSLVDEIAQSLPTIQKNLSEQIGPAVDKSVQSFADSMLEPVGGAEGLKAKLAEQQTAAGGDAGPESPYSNGHGMTGIVAGISQLHESGALDGLKDFVSLFKSPPSTEQQLASQFNLLFKGMQLGQKIAKSGHVGDDLERAFTETFINKSE